MMWLGPSARALLAYMSEASLKKGPAWVLSTMLDAGRLNAGRYGCGSSIVLIIYAIVKTPLCCFPNNWSFFDNVPTDF